jgi:hypothetical protein
MSTAVLPRLLTPMDVSAWLSLPVRQVERMGRRGELPAVELPDGSLVFDAEDLAGWLRRRKTNGPATES